MFTRGGGYTNGYDNYNTHSSRHGSTYRALRAVLVIWILCRLTVFAVRTVVAALVLPVLLATAAIAIHPRYRRLARHARIDAGRLLYWWVGGLYPAIGSYTPRLKIPATPATPATPPRR